MLLFITFDLKPLLVAFMRYKFTVICLGQLVEDSEHAANGLFRSDRNTIPLGNSPLERFDDSED